MTSLEELIEIYGGREAKDVSKDQNYVRICQENDGNPIFHAERFRIENIKRKLEKEAGIQKTRQKQVKFALRFFHRLVGSKDDEDEVCRRLTLASYYPQWTDKQKLYFDETCVLVKKKLDYFLSFTQRNRSGAGNPINSYHRYLIQSIGLPDPKDSQENELARMLDRLLQISRYQFRGFFFPAHEGDSQQATEKFLKALDNSMVFIQIVQNEMFSKHYQHQNRPNYCYIEYKQAIEKKKEMIFIFADGQHPQDLIPEEDAQFEFDDWYELILGADCVHMEPTRIADERSNIPDSIDKLKKRLVEAVQRHRETLWEGAPGDLD